MHTRLAWLASLVLVLASTAAAEVYRYTDAHGQTFYTDSYYDVPEQYRDQIKEVPGDAAGRGRLTVVPGLMGPPKGAGGKAEAGKARPGAKDAGPTSEFQKGFERGFESVRGRVPAGLSPGMLVFAILVGFIVALAIGGGFLKTACNIVGERPLALGQAMLIVLIQGIAGMLASGALSLTLAVAGKPSPTLTAIGALGSFAATTTANAAVLKGMHCGAWGPAFKVTFVVMLLGLLIAAPFVYCAMR